MVPSPSNRIPDLQGTLHVDLEEENDLHKVTWVGLNGGEGVFTSAWRVNIHQ
jgi:hypothetical protein